MSFRRRPESITYEAHRDSGLRRNDSFVIRMDKFAQHARRSLRLRHYEVPLHNLILIKNTEIHHFKNNYYL
ncbi:MAG TPA: hypothetical protein VHO72_00335 [Bacteroidales bacterium]|nr:hypothetical protein [Bacteroidales bacterium]